ncbi:hypothetical protein [Streptomyces sp. KL110A]|uniref:hypothetical protein n=1 Tax=Streptomyces sp. KL110A TaxID=3384221 RepID=UPI0038C7A3E0
MPALLHLDGAARLVAGTAGALGLAGALVLAVRRGPLRAATAAPAARLWTLWLLAYAVAGDGLLEQVLGGGPDGAWRIDPAPLLGLALAVAPAAWCAHLFAGRARRRIADSRGLADFAAATRAWLLAAVLLHLAALTALLALTGLTAGALALGALLLTARLLAVHGHAGTAAAALAAACAAEALGLASVLASRLPLPGFDALAAPVRAAVAAWRPAPSRARLRRRRARPAGPRDHRPHPGLGPHHPLTPALPRSRRRGRPAPDSSPSRRTKTMTPPSPAPAGRHEGAAR